VNTRAASARKSGPDPRARCVIERSGFILVLFHLNDPEA
jgi:hypothetical protein